MFLQLSKIRDDHSVVHENLPTEFLFEFIPARNSLPPTDQPGSAFVPTKTQTDSPGSMLDR